MEIFDNVEQSEIKENSPYDIPAFAKGNEASLIKDYNDADRKLTIQKDNSPIIDTQEQIQMNRENGDAREQMVESELKNTYPEADGYDVLSEVYLRDKDGEIVKDPLTGEARRVDFAVVKDQDVVKSVEVTSLTASKEEQLSKEDRIRIAGGNYIKDPVTGKEYCMQDEVRTEVRRRE